MAIEMTNITKVFPGALANDRVCLEVRAGEIHALLGENGAGKSTLMSLLFGLYEPEEGQIKIRGQEVRIRNPKDATALGIGMVHQHFKLIHTFTVTENIILGMEPRNSWGNLDLKNADKQVAALSDAYSLAVDPKARISQITLGMQQRVEILKILYRNATILIFDEPTAVLTPQEIQELLEIFRRLKAEGKTILFITHKLKEIKAAADRCTILRRGKSVETLEVAYTQEQELAEKMVGRTLHIPAKKKTVPPGEVILHLDKLTVMGPQGIPAVREVSLKVRAGEVLGIAGVDGNGQSELIAAIAGLLPVKSGAIFLNGKNITQEGIRRRQELGIGLVPEDRQSRGLVLDFQIAENLILKRYGKPPFSNTLGFLQVPFIKNHAEQLIAQFDIRGGKGAATLAKSMSGGNQQKVIMARELHSSPAVLLIAQPTRGLDVGAIEYMHQRIIAERDKGKAILLVSFELEEILNLCDRIVTIFQGSLLGEVSREEAEEGLLGAMMGGVAYEKTKAQG